MLQRERGKLLFLQGIAEHEGFEVIPGGKQMAGERNKLSCGHVTLQMYYQEATMTYIKGGIAVNLDKIEHELLVFNGELEADDTETYLLVIVSNALWVKTNGMKIAGNYENDGAFVLHEGDIIEVSKDTRGRYEKFMVVRAGNELGLFKKNR